MDFKDRVVIISGAGGGLGKAYATYFASHGANVLINDMSKQNADAAVKEINDANKREACIANYDSAVEGEKIVKQAVDKWGKVDILINNAGILRDKSFKAMTVKEWNIIHEVHVKASYALAKACWPVFRKNKYGRIVNTASAAGLYGNFGQANYSAAKLGMTGFSKTLAKEGAKYNIHANTIAPVAASQMTETVMPPEMLANLKPEKIAPLVAYLCHESTETNGQIFEAGAGWFGHLRWQKSKGAVFKADDTFTPAAVKERWEEINDYSHPSYPQAATDSDYVGLLEQAKKVQSNPQGAKLDYKGKVVIVTGAGAGLGRAHSLMFGKSGAKVVVNDMNKEAAQKVVDEIKKAGGEAVAQVGSVTEGEAVVKAALDAFGAIHVIVNNAGILRDKAFANATDADWDLVWNVHVNGTYAVTKAAWPHFQKQKYGRIVNTCSVSGLHGSFGQANYSTAKMAILGFTKTLAIEGKKYNILANTLVPNAGTAMTSTIWPEEMVKAFSPAFVAPIVGYLCSEENDTTQGLYEVSGGWAAAIRWQRTAGYSFPINKTITAEDVKSKWSTITKFDDNATNPTSTGESLESIIGNFGNESEEADNSSSDSSALNNEDSEDVDIVKEAKKNTSSDEFSYTERDVMLYNLGIGATEKDTKFVFEGDEDFQALPTFGVIPQFACSSGLPLDWLPNFSPMMLLHGEQYLVIKDQIPTSGTLVNKAKVLEVLDKGKAAAVTVAVETTHKESGKVVFENTSTVFIRGSGGFGGRKTGKDRGAATDANNPPKRKPDAVIEEKTTDAQAALYRLSGDFNPLHIDPNFASVGGFEKPILHGLCSYGIAGKHVLQKFGKWSSIKARFTGHVFPGETLVTEMWKEGDKVIFVTKVKERGTQALGNAACTLV